MNENASTESSPAVSGFKKWLPLTVLSLAIMIIVIDTTILNVSLRTIINDLHTDIQSIQWVITAYSLMLAAFTITGGRLGDLFGRKRMFILGAVIFAIGSFLASISHTVGMLIIGEAIVEGIGAALMTPATTSLLVSNYKGRDRQTAFGVWGGIAAASAALGPVFGGWLTTHYSWRWAFRINLFVAAALLLASVLIREYRDTEEKPQLDIWGIILSSLGMFAVVFAFIKATDYGWWTAKQQFILWGHTLNLGQLSVTPVFILIGILILAAFAAWQRHLGRHNRTPLVSLKLFKNKQFVVGASIVSIMSLGLSGLTFAIPVFLQAVKNLDALHTGIAMLPLSLAIMVLAPLSAALSKFIRPKWLIIGGLALNIIGFFVLRQSLSVTASVWALAPGFALFGAGMGLIMAQSSNMTLSAVSVKESGEASGVNNTLRQLGATLGAAILGSILITSLVTNLVSGVGASRVIPQALKPQISQAVSTQASSIEFGSSTAQNSDTPEFITDEIKNISLSATVQGGKDVLFYGAWFMVAGLLLSFFLPSSKNIEVEESVAENSVAAEPAAPLPTPVGPAAEPAAAGESAGKRILVSLIVLLLLAAALVGGYKWGQNSQNDADTQAPIASDNNDNPGQNGIVPSPTPTPVVTPTPIETPTPTPAPTPAYAAYTNPGLHFSVQVPSNWRLSEKGDGIEVVDGAGNYYTIRSYSVSPNGETMAGLVQFLNSQTYIHAPQETTFAGRDSVAFNIDGVYRQGFAFLSGNRLYYVMGPEVENTPLANLTVN